MAKRPVAFRCPWCGHDVVVHVQSHMLVRTPQLLYRIDPVGLVLAERAGAIKTNQTNTTTSHFECGQCGRWLFRYKIGLLSGYQDLVDAIEAKELITGALGQEPTWEE